MQQRLGASLDEHLAAQSDDAARRKREEEAAEAARSLAKARSAHGATVDAVRAEARDAIEAEQVRVRFRANPNPQPYPNPNPNPKPWRSCRSR